MHEIYINLILSGIYENYYSEEEFYQNQLGISFERWEKWKQGKMSLSPEENQKIKNIFSDYEWMLLQKSCDKRLFTQKSAILLLPSIKN